jgi:hypothetical protein
MLAGGEIFLSSFSLSQQTWYAAARHWWPEHPVIQHHTNSIELHIAELLMEYMQERREKEDADDQTGSWEKAPSNRKHDTRAEVAVIF